MSNSWLYPFVGAVAGAFLFDSVFDVVGPKSRALALAAGAGTGYYMISAAQDDPLTNTEMNTGIDFAWDHPVLFAGVVLGMTIVVNMGIAAFIEPGVEILDSFVPLLRTDRMGLLAVSVATVGALLESDIIAWPYNIGYWMIYGSDGTNTSGSGYMPFNVTEKRSRSDYSPYTLLFDAAMIALGPPLVIIGSLQSAIVADPNKTPSAMEIILNAPFVAAQYQWIRVTDLAIDIFNSLKGGSDYFNILHISGQYTKLFEGVGNLFNQQSLKGSVLNPDALDPDAPHADDDDGSAAGQTDTADPVTKDKDKQKSYVLWLERLATL